MMRSSLRSEVLVSLSLLMLTATAVLAALLLETQAMQSALLERLAARALVEDASRPLPLTRAATPELRWWTLRDSGRVSPYGPHSEPLDAETRALGEESRRQERALMQHARPWESLRFAVPVDGEVRVARLPPAASGAWLLALLLADVVVFTAFGAVLLRGRIVRPLHRLGGAARAIAEGDFDARVSVEGPAEVCDLATSFNFMSEALDARTSALEKAVGDLRDSNRDLRDAREGLDRAERLAAVGRLAAGVAHEVGNPMGAVLAFLDLARRDTGLSEQSQVHLDRAAAEGGRVRRILRQLLDFSRPPRTRHEEVDVAMVAEETAELVRAQRRYSKIEIEISADGSAPLAMADRSQLVQILLNLLLNAADALDSSPEPRIHVRVEGCAFNTRSGDRAEETAARRQHDAVECTVSDNGPGIPLTDRPRVFDPFFTTKDAGQGTGLGLSNALRFAEEFGGRLVLGEAGDAGAMLRLTLPAAASARRDGDVRASD